MVVLAQWVFTNRRQSHPTDVLSSPQASHGALSIAVGWVERVSKTKMGKHLNKENFAIPWRI